MVSGVGTRLIHKVKGLYIQDQLLLLVPLLQAVTSGLIAVARLPSDHDTTDHIQQLLTYYNALASAHDLRHLPGSNEYYR